LIIENKPNGGEKASRECPSCHNERIWKDGIRETRNGFVQRYICHDCGYRFSESSALSLDQSHSGVRQVGALLTEAINLTKVEPLRSGLAGATKPDQATSKGLLLQYAYWLQKEGYGQDSRYVSCIRMLINHGANMYDPENVKVVIAQQSWKNGTKMQAVYAYGALTKMLKISWEPPRYVQEETLPSIPDERDLDQLIAGCRSQRMATYLQTLKETFADPTEALRLRWIDFAGNVITINCPVKGHRPRQLEVSNRLVSMLNSLPRTSERIFATTYRSVAQCFMRVRKRVAQTTQNPRIVKITFVSFRHWGATNVYSYTKNILLVQKLLGHKKIQNTMKYTQLIQFKDDEYDVATATTVEEAKDNLKVGFEYVAEKNGIMLFKRPKRYSTYSQKY